MLAHLMIHTAVVSRPTASKGTSGAEVDTFATAYAALPGMMQPVTASWQVQYAQRKINTTHTYFTNANPTIQNGDKLTFSGRTFYVQGVRNLCEMGRVTAIDLQEKS